MTINTQERNRIVVDPMGAVKVLNQALVRSNKDATPYLVNALKLLGQTPPTDEAINKAQESWAMFNIASILNENAVRVPSTYDRVNLMWNELTRLGKEELHSVAVDKRYIVLAKRKIVEGGVDSIPKVADRDVFMDAIMTKADYVVLYHNHPVGSARPSQPDKRTTRDLCRKGNQLGIQVLDHIIISDTDWYSMRDNGLMPRLKPIK